MTPVGGKVEGDRQALLPGSKVLAIKRIGFLGRREARTLPDRPGLTRIHGQTHAVAFHLAKGGSRVEKDDEEDNEEWGTCCADRQGR